MVLSYDDQFKFWYNLCTRNGSSTPEEPSFVRTRHASSGGGGGGSKHNTPQDESHDVYDDDDGGDSHPIDSTDTTTNKTTNNTTNVGVVEQPRSSGVAAEHASSSQQAAGSQGGVSKVSLPSARRPMHHGNTVTSTRPPDDLAHKDIKKPRGGGRGTQEELEENVLKRKVRKTGKQSLIELRRQAQKPQTRARSDSLGSEDDTDTIAGFRDDDGIDVFDKSDDDGVDEDSEVGEIEHTKQAQEEARKVLSEDGLRPDQSVIIEKLHSELTQGGKNRLDGRQWETIYNKMNELANTPRRQLPWELKSRIQQAAWPDGVHTSPSIVPEGHHGGRGGGSAAPSRLSSRNVAGSASTHGASRGSASAAEAASASNTTTNVARSASTRGASRDSARALEVAGTQASRGASRGSPMPAKAASTRGASRNSSSVTLNTPTRGARHGSRSVVVDTTSGDNDVSMPVNTTSDSKSSRNVASSASSHDASRRRGHADEEVDKVLRDVKELTAATKTAVLEAYAKGNNFDEIFEIIEKGTNLKLTEQLKQRLTKAQWPKKKAKVVRFETSDKGTSSQPQLGGGGLEVDMNTLKLSLRRAQEAWNDQVQAKREPKSPQRFWKTRPVFQMSKTSEFSLAIKDYSRKLLQVILQARRDKHLGLDEAFLAQHAKLVGFYVGNSQIVKSQASSFRAMRSLIVELPKGSCLVDYIATTDKATYGHMVADDVELLLHQTTKQPPRSMLRRPVKRGRNEVPSLVLARPFKQQFGKASLKQVVSSPSPSPSKQTAVQQLYEISKALNAPVVVSHRKVDDDDFDASKHTEFVLDAVLPSLFSKRLSKPSHSVLLGGATKGTLMFAKQGAPQLSWPANPPIWVDSSQVSPEMFVLFCGKRNILPLGHASLGQKGVAAQVASIEVLLEKLPAWFFTSLLEYASMVQVDLGVLAELITAQSLLNEFQDSQLNTMLLTDKAGMLAQLGQSNMLANLSDQLGATNDWQQGSDYFDVAHVANMLDQAKHLYS